ncbi:putative epoxide hydrolase [Astrocystis sublimbata]|nr:putative epoxide hydrolase [Astrocystis sublimbata]
MSFRTKEHDVFYAGCKKIHYHTAGPVLGPLIIFIHGWVGTGILWKAQINTFAALGFRVIAPDMPGYGQSTSRRVIDDYHQEAIVEGMKALLEAQGRDAAIWVGHDWGAGVVSSVATQHPEVVKALITACVPFRSIELGWGSLLPLVNRDLYPVGEYELGQWDYMKKYEEDFENVVKWFEDNVTNFCKIAMLHPQPPQSRFASMFSTVRKYGWFGGIPNLSTIATNGQSLLPPDVYDSFVGGMQKTGFWGPCAYYMHHERNAQFNGRKSNNALTQPVLFIHAAWDVVCDTKTSRLAEPMRRACSNLTEATIQSDHYPQYQKPSEFNAVVCRFIIEKVPSEWPGFWDTGYMSRRNSGRSPV